MLFHPFLLAVAGAVTASPLVARTGSHVTLPLARHFNLTGGAAAILAHDRARARAFKTGFLAQDAGIPVPAANDVTSYTVQVEISGSPRTYNLLVDTGSSNTWAGANTLGNPYSPDPSCLLPQPKIVNVTYGSGSFEGVLCHETITIGGDTGLNVPGQGVAAATASSGFSGVDGILGIGPTDLTEGTIVGSPTESIPTVTDNAFALGLINERAVGVFFAPTQSGGNPGELTFGGADASKFAAPLTYVPITTTSPANQYVGIDQTIAYGSARSQILPLTAGIVDTGTTLLLIASDAFALYQAATGAVEDSATGLLKITPTQYENLESLFFTIGTATFVFTKDAQIWPRALNTAIGGDAESIYLIVGDLRTSSGAGLDFIDGMSFLQRFYTVYDSTPGANRFGIATTEFTASTSNYGS